MYSYLTNLITNKFYGTKEEASMKTDVFFAVNRLTEEEYMNLATLINSTYVEQ